MFRATFLGHQGWMVSTASTHILIDPLLTDAFGHGGAVGVVYPPRTFELERVPPIDAVFITHEHDDHFDVASLHCLDRAIPVFMSGRSSGAAWDLLSAMGFAAAPVWPEQIVAVGDLRVRSFAAERSPYSNEWDVFPFLAHDTDAHGSLLSSVDVPITAGVLDAVARSSVGPGIWCYANNTTAAAFAPAATSDEAALAGVVSRRLAAVTTAWGAPAATVITGGGWSFEGDRAWLNRRVFPIDSAGLAARVRRASPGANVLAPTPGTVVQLRGGALVPSPPRCSFLQPRPRAAWPDRSLSRDAATEHITPACDVPVDIEQLADALTDFARYLYGGTQFVAIHGAPRRTSTGHRIGLCFDARDRGGSVVLAYDPRRCRFAPDSGGDGRGRFVSGYACWASDLLALLHGHLGPSALCNTGRVRTWNHRPDLLRVSDHDLWRFAQPLRRPAAHAELYARLRRAQPPGAPQIRAAVRRSAPAKRWDA